jgi:hypothetical protein
MGIFSHMRCIWNKTNHQLICQWLEQISLPDVTISVDVGVAMHFHMDLIHLLVTTLAITPHDQTMVRGTSTHLHMDHHSTIKQIIHNAKSAIALDILLLTTTIASMKHTNMNLVTRALLHKQASQLFFPVAISIGIPILLLPIM